MLRTSWLTSILHKFSVRPVIHRRRKSSMSISAACRVERLEPRVLLSASPAGVETQVNTEILGNQQTSLDVPVRAVATDADGDYVVTWSSDGQDGSGWGVYAQRYNATGVAQGGEIHVSTTTLNAQTEASVAMDATGDFVITWTSYAQDGSGFGIYAQRYNSAGVAQGGEFQVNATTTGNQQYPSVAMDASGNFVVTWSSFGQDGDGWGVYLRRYDANGVAQGGETLVNTYTTGA